MDSVLVARLSNSLANHAPLQYFAESSSVEHLSNVSLAHTVGEKHH